MKLNLGCGWEKLDGYVNLDSRKEVKPDIVHSLDEKLPFEDNSVDEILAKNVIEHLNNPIGFVKECHRVLIDGGKLIITSSHISQLESAGELDHKRTGLSVFSFHFCSKYSIKGRQYYGNFIFEIEKVKLRVHPLLQIFADLSPIKYEKYLSRFFSAREIEFVLKKPIK